ncbi:hypothetical protein ABKV19_008179 [Rosa sericea]
MNLTTMRISPMSSVGFFTLQNLKLAAIPSPSSSFRSFFKPLSKTFLYCHSHTPRPQVLSSSSRASQSRPYKPLSLLHQKQQAQMRKV